MGAPVTTSASGQSGEPHPKAGHPSATAPGNAGLTGSEGLISRVGDAGPGRR
jgi:hypothetical protein